MCASDEDHRRLPSATACGCVGASFSRSPARFPSEIAAGGRAGRQCRLTHAAPPTQDARTMLAIDLTGKRALVAGVADDGGFGFAIAKALREAGATVCVGTWPPAY